MGLRHVGFGVETTVGTAVAPTRWLEALSESVQSEPVIASPPVLRSYSKRAIDQLHRPVKGNVEFLANYQGIGFMLKYLYGSVTSQADTPATGFNTHSFPATSGIPSTDRIGMALTIECRRDGSLSWRYAGCKPISWRHDMPLGDYGKINCGFLGYSEALAGPASATFPTLSPMKPVHYSASFDGTSLAVRSGFVEINNPLDEPLGWGSTAFVAEPDRNGEMTATAQLEMYFDSTTQYAKFAAASDVDVAIAAVVSANEKITYNIDKARILQATPHNSGRDRLVGTFVLEGYFNTTGTENIQTVLINADTTP